MAIRCTNRRSTARKAASAVAAVVLALAQWLGLVTACSSGASTAFAAQPGEVATIADGRRINAESDYSQTITLHYDAASGDTLFCVEHGVATAPGQAIVQDIVGQTTRFSDWETLGPDIYRTWTQAAATDCALIQLYANERHAGDDAIAFTQCFIWSYVRAGFDIDAMKDWPQYIPYRFMDERQAVVDYVKASRRAWTGKGLLYTKTNRDQMVAKFWAEPNTGDLVVRKSSADESVSANNPCYSLEGAVFGIYRDEACTDEAVRVTTDASGNGAARGLVAGTYWVRELQAPAGYALDGKALRVDVPAGDIAVLEAPDTPQTCPVGVAVRKLDAETGTGESYGGASLEGAEFRVDFYAGMFELDDLPEAPAKTFVVSTGADGAASLDRPLPLGTVVVQEVKAPQGYVLNGEKRLAHITSNGNEAEVNTYNAPQVADERVRGDLSFVKADEDNQRRMARVAFRLTCEETQESHVIVTDENGCFDSADFDEGQMTNANDAAMGSDGTVDSSKLDPGLGVWFGGTAPRDGEGALPYGTYLLEELRCDANKGYRLVSASLTVSRDGKTVRLGTFDDKRPALETTLVFADGQKTCPAGEIELTDTVRYEGLERGHEYRLVGELHDIDEDGTDRGVVSVSEATFSPQLGSGEQDVRFSVDARALGGHRLVAYEYLWDGDEVLCEHEDPADEGQSVRVPRIATELSGDAAHQADATAETVVLVDNVSYRNLEPGTAYELVGALRLKAGDGSDAGPALDDDGNPIVARARFTPEARDGVQQVTFEFKGRALAGSEAVAFESLEKDGVEYAVHTDIEDASQLVSFPALRTCAASEIAQDHHIPAAGDQTVIDSVELERLEPGAEYELRAALHLRGADGSDEGEVAQAAKTFTADAEDMSVSMELSLIAGRFAGRELVVFEELYRAGVRVGSHADIDDAAQSVSVPVVKTTLSFADGQKELAVAGDATVQVVDTVEYAGLVPGRAYRVEGVLHLRADDGTDAGPLAASDGSPVSGSAEFVAEASSGSTQVTFTVDAGKLVGRQAVAFERLLCKDVLLASHEDITDDAQAVSFTKKPEAPTPGTAKTPATGDEALPVFACAVLGGLLAFCAWAIAHASSLGRRDG
ncbi:MAG: VaFE repeat-containing surface-anchored protein [Coriobacteriia bacterium]|nr:VaFE repeat-containing surface-anchored protein [Coriobacteriia bacterium]